MTKLRVDIRNFVSTLKNWS